MNRYRFDPIDYCGCGDIGYLTKRTISIPLAQGVGEITDVPVYKCNDPSCQEYNLPRQVAQRMDEIAETMERLNLTRINFTWNESTETNHLDPVGDTTFQDVESWTCHLKDQEFEDAKVIFVIPGEIVILQHRVDPTEFYALRIERSEHKNDYYFSLSKFYIDEDPFDYNHYLLALETGQIKELGTMSYIELDDVLEDEFGAKIQK